MSPGSVGVAMGVFTELGVAGPVPFVLHAPALSDQSQQGIWAGPQAGVAPRGALVQPHRGVRLFNPPRWRLMLRLPLLRVTVSLITSTIQALPGQFALMCSAASLACSSQTVSRPCFFS
jgi:hypothetical protein